MPIPFPPDAGFDLSYYDAARFGKALPVYKSAHIERVRAKLGLTADSRPSKETKMTDQGFQLKRSLLTKVFLDSSPRGHVVHQWFTKALWHDPDEYYWQVPTKGKKISLVPRKDFYRLVLSTAGMARPGDRVDSDRDRRGIAFHKEYAKRRAADVRRTQALVSCPPTTQCGCPGVPPGHRRCPKTILSKAMSKECKGITLRTCPGVKITDAEKKRAAIVDRDRRAAEENYEQSSVPQPGYRDNFNTEAEATEAWRKYGVAIDEEEVVRAQIRLRKELNRIARLNKAMAAWIVRYDRAAAR